MNVNQTSRMARTSFVPLVVRAFVEQVTDGLSTFLVSKIVFEISCLKRSCFYIAYVDAHNILSANSQIVV